MSKINELELALANAKKQEKLDQRTKELEQLIAEYQGKCFGTHTFNRAHASAHMGANYYEKFYIKDSEIYVLEHTIRVHHVDAYHKKSMKHILYDRNIYERKLTVDNEYHANYNLYSGYSFYRKEISLEKFKQLWEAGQEAYVFVRNAFDNKLPELKMEDISIGDHSREATIEKCLSDMGVEMIDFKLYPDVHHVIEYRTLPMFDRNRWMPKQYAKQILEWHINELTVEANGRFINPRSYEYLHRQIKILKDFISKEL